MYIVQDWILNNGIIIKSENCEFAYMNICKCKKGFGRYKEKEKFKSCKVLLKL